MLISTQSAHSAYRSGQVGSAGPLRIVILLYEGGIRFCRQALDEFDQPGTRGQALGRAHRIVAELMASLDAEQGGEIAQNLEALYGFMLDEITNANARQEPRALETVIDLLSTLLSAWREIEIREGDQREAVQP